MKFAHGKTCKYAARSWFMHAGVSLQWQNESVRQRSQQIDRLVLRVIALFESWIIWIHSWLETRYVRVSSVKLPLSGTVYYLLVSNSQKYLSYLLNSRVVVVWHSPHPSCLPAVVTLHHLTCMMVYLYSFETRKKLQSRKKSQHPCIMYLSLWINSGRASFWGDA